MAELDAIEEIGTKVIGALDHPKPLDISLPVFNAVLAAQYYETYADVGYVVLDADASAADSQRVLALLEPAVAATAGRALGASLDDLGSATIRADLASMRHETQYTRLFRS